MGEAPFTIRTARSDDDLDAVEKLFRAYAASLEIGLDYQDFEGELASLPGKYAPPSGELLLAYDGSGESVGCVGLRSLAPKGICEMKRLYVDPAGRGLGLGQALVEAIVKIALDRGYEEMRLDTLPSMTQALGLYRRAGFVEIPAYYETPVERTVFMSLRLRQRFA